MSVPLPHFPNPSYSPIVLNLRTRNNQNSNNRTVPVSAALGASPSAGMPRESMSLFHSLLPPSATPNHTLSGLPTARSNHPTTLFSPNLLASASGPALQASASVRQYLNQPIKLSAGGEMDYRDSKTKIKETNFINRLLQSPKINEFVQQLLFSLIAKAKKLKFSSDAIINNLQIKYSIKQEIVYIKLVGLLKEEAEALYDAADLQTFRGVCAANKITLTQIMGSVFNFQTDDKFLKACIEATPGYREKFMAGVQKYLAVPSNLPYDSFVNEYVDAIDYVAGPSNVYYWIWYYFTTDVKNLFFINQHRILNVSAADKKLFDSDPAYKVAHFILEEKNPKYAQFQKVLGKMTIEGEQLDVQAVAGNIFSAPIKNSIWTQVMQKNKKEVISGPSGSAAVLFRFFFETTRILDIRNIEHMIMLLLAITAQFSVLFHSIPEVLQMYMDCVYNAVGPGVVPTYSINMVKPDEVDYLQFLVNKYIPGLDTIGQEVSSRDIEKYHVPPRPQTSLQGEIVELHEDAGANPVPSMAPTAIAISHSAGSDEPPQLGHEAPSAAIAVPAVHLSAFATPDRSKGRSGSLVSNPLNGKRLNFQLPPTGASGFTGGFRKTKVKRRVNKRRTKRHNKK